MRGVRGLAPHKTGEETVKKTVKEDWPLLIWVTLAVLLNLAFCGLAGGLIAMGQSTLTTIVLTGGMASSVVWGVSGISMLIVILSGDPDDH